MTRSFTKGFGLFVAAAGLFIAFAPLERHGELSVPVHHLFHAMIIAGGCALALTWARPSSDSREHAAWLLPSLAVPVAMMLLMTPSLYPRLETLPGLHVGEHLALFCTGYAAVACAQRYRAGMGWVLGALTVLMALTAAGGFGALMS